MSAEAAARLRSIPAGFEPGPLAAIDGMLGRIAAEERVGIGLAIESGSRAWGFPSPDSDYDCRFLFVRGAEDYLSPWQKRDVIETPLEGELDVNGWELGKALKLLLKGNAVVVEWLMSPIVYDGDAWFREAMTAFARAHGDRAGMARHYLHLGERQRRSYFADGKPIRLKKLFYALRPAAALRWLRLHPEAPVAPMHFPTLLEESEPPREIAALVRELIARKAETRELGEGPLPKAIKGFVDAEFARAAETLPVRSAATTREARAAAEALFRDAVARLGPVRSTPAPGGAKKGP
ncbi:MAG: DNA polymerase beta superfamily protein [Allosphingosinicella sp.]